MGQLFYNENYTPTVNEMGETVYTLRGEVRNDIPQSDDYERLGEGYATSTVLYYDMTDRDMTTGWNRLV